MRLFLALLLACASAASAAGRFPARDTIEQLTSIFENDTPRLQYAYCENIRDRRGYTFGFAGFTSGTYDGTLFLKEYRRLRPGSPLEKYLPAFEKIDAGPHDGEGRNPSVAGLAGFPSAFRSCAADPAFRQAQQNLADRLYWDPSQRIARRIGARLEITRGQFYDACINLGEDGLEELVRRTNRIAGGAPKNGVGEPEWLSKFLSLRLRDLTTGDRTQRHAADRARVYQQLLAEGNVHLLRPIRFVCYGDSFVLRP